MNIFKSISWRIKRRRECRQISQELESELGRRPTLREIDNAEAMRIIKWDLFQRCLKQEEERERERRAEAHAELKKLGIDIDYE
jgi:hypothetical protein